MFSLALVATSGCAVDLDPEAENAWSEDAADESDDDLTTQQSAEALTGTTCLNADGSGGKDAYVLIKRVLGNGAIEEPDAAHDPEHRHIREGDDGEVGPHFVFAMHRDVDDGPTGGKNRQRREIKVYSGSNEGLKGKEGDTFTYTWRFKIDPRMKLSKAFQHFFQLKSSGGDNAIPMLTFSGKKTSKGDKLQVHQTACTGCASQVLAETDWAGARNVWLDARVTATYRESESVKVTVKKPDGDVLLSVDKRGVDMWRDGDFVRPKWGIYRGLSDKDELRSAEDTVRFANFGITKGDRPTSDCRR